MPDKNRISTARRRRSDPPAYARGNENWNTPRYKESVKTSRTDTRVVKIPRATLERGRSYYYDNTPDALRKRRREELKRRRDNWRAEARKNRRRRVALRRFLSLLIITAAVIASSSVAYKLFFVASEITVTGETSYTPKEIITAAGLGKDVNLFSFSSRVAANDIKFYCPKISNATFNRTIPNKVQINLEEEKPVYYAEIHGDIYSLSNSLRILDKLKFFETGGLIKLKLQTVSKAVAGDKIELVSERAQKFLESATEVLDSSPLKQRLTQIDLRNDFNIVMVANDKYKLIFGTQDDYEIKVRLAAKILEDDIFKSGSKAQIDLRDTNKTSVIIDNQLEFD